MTHDTRQSNRIPQVQNEPAQLQRLGAQRYLYGRAKTVLAAQMALGAPIAIVVVLVTWHWSHLRFAAATFGVVAFLLDMFLLTPWQSSLRETAAKIQEAFDCDALGLPWSKQKAGKKIDHEVEIDYSIRYQRVAAQHHPITDW